MKKIALLSLTFLFLCISLALADEGVKPRSGLQGIEFLTGYGKGGLRAQKAYQVAPFIVDLDFDFKQITKKIGFNPPSLVQFQLEPFMDWIYGPHSNIETGVGLMFKFGLVPDTWKFQLYIKGGSAPSFTSLKYREEADGFNFLSSGCAGFHYFITKKIALTAEYRYRHLSNAGRASPNRGVNTQLMLAGVAYTF